MIQLKMILVGLGCLVLPIFFPKEEMDFVGDNKRYRPRKCCYVFLLEFDFHKLSIV